MNATSFFLSFFLMFLCFTHTNSKVHSYMRKGSSLSVEGNPSSFITSPDNSFTCGFYEVGRNACGFGIWFTHSKDRTVVWMANRDKPVNGKGSKVSLRRDGAMVLTDVDGSTVWQTNTIPISTDVEKAELLDSGNLVLKNPQGKILWQSIDFPTDTLLPHQTFTKSKKLISATINGYRSPNFPGSLYLKLPASLEVPEQTLLGTSSLQCRSSEGDEVSVGSTSMYNMDAKRFRPISKSPQKQR